MFNYGCCLAVGQGEKEEKEKKAEYRRQETGETREKRKRRNTGYRRKLRKCPRFAGIKIRMVRYIAPYRFRSGCVLDFILLIGLGFIAWIDSLLNFCHPFGMLDLHAFDLDDAFDGKAANDNNRDPAPE